MSIGCKCLPLKPEFDSVERLVTEEGPGETMNEFVDDGTQDKGSDEADDEIQEDLRPSVTYVQHGVPSPDVQVHQKARQTQSCIK